MFRQILWTQFKWTRVMLAILAVVAFLTPAVAWRLADLVSGSAAYAILIGFSNIGPTVALTSIVGAFVLAAQPWTVDAATRHVYALSLPVPWPRYVAMRFGAGLITLLVPTLALWFGSLLALSMVELPSTLRAYPGTLALRFLLASALAYAATFALQHLAGRKSALVLLFTMLGGGFIWFALMAAGFNEGLDRIGSWLTEWPGPFAIYTADWKLIDV